MERSIPEAFGQSHSGSNPGLEGFYLDGVSITHGAPGSRQHIWSFASAVSEISTFKFAVCPCSNTDTTWPFEVPSFVGNNYFCDAGNPGPDHSFTTVYADDPLWDGAGCGPTSSCCQLNTPPWFCTTLPQPTTDDIELRICNGGALTDEDTLVNLVDIYIM